MRGSPPGLAPRGHFTTTPGSDELCHLGQGVRSELHAPPLTNGSCHLPQSSSAIALEHGAGRGTGGP